MSATFNWAKTYGASPGTREDLGSTGNLFNFMDEDSNTKENYTTKPITASDTTDEGNSYEVWLQAHFTGTFNRVDNLQFWMSTDFSPNTGLSIKWVGDGQETYATPTKDDSAVAVDAVPSSDPASANVSIAGSLSGELTAAGYSDYIVLQLHAGLAASPGDTSLATFSLSYDES